MNVLVHNMPIVWLLILVVGIICIIYSVIKIANYKINSEQDYVVNDSENKEDLKELFSYFLEEEEKKNQDIRQLLKDSINTNMSKNINNNTTNPNQTKLTNASDKVYSEVIKYYSEGKNEEWIAKKLKKGVGEVKLIISLYNMK